MLRSSKDKSSYDNGHIDVVVKDVKPGEVGSGSDTRFLLILFISLVIDLLAFTVILPLFPAILEHYGHKDGEVGIYWVLKNMVNGFRELVGAPDTPRWNSVLFGGILGSMFSFLQYLTSPVIGAVSDVYGRRPMMLITCIGMAASYAIWAVSGNFTIFVIARIVGGISKGNISLSTAIVSDVSHVTTPERRSKGMALIGIAFSVGFLLGPLIGAYFSHRARNQQHAEGGAFYTAPALYALALASLDVVFLFFFLKESLPKEKRTSSIGAVLSNVIPLIHPIKLFKFSAVRGVTAGDLKNLRDVGFIYFIYLFLYSGLEFTLTFLTHNRFEFDSMQQGKMFFIIGIVMIFVHGGVVRRVKQGKEISTAIKGVFLLIPSFIIIGVAYSPLVLYAGLILFSFASATVVPCLTTEISNYGSADQKGTVTGIFRSLGALARALGPVIASSVYWCLGPFYCYTIGGLALIYPLVLLMKIRKRD